MDCGGEGRGGSDPSTDGERSGGRRWRAVGREQAEAGRWRGGARWAGEASGHARPISSGDGAAGWRGLAALVAAGEPARGGAGTGWRRGALGEVVAAGWRLCG